jgi:hypothetical protein
LAKLPCSQNDNEEIKSNFHQDMTKFQHMCIIFVLPAASDLIGTSAMTARPGSLSPSLPAWHFIISVNIYYVCLLLLVLNLLEATLFSYNGLFF